MNLKFKILAVLAMFPVAALSTDVLLYGQTTNVPVLKQKVESQDVEMVQAMNNAKPIYKDDYAFIGTCYVSTTGKAKDYYSEIIEGLVYTNQDFAKNLEGILGLSLESLSNHVENKKEVARYCAGIVPYLLDVEKVVYEINQGVKYIYGLQLSIEKKVYKETGDYDVVKNLLAMARYYANQGSPHALALVAQDYLERGDMESAEYLAMESVKLEYKVGFFSMGLIEKQRGNDIKALAWMLLAANGDLYSYDWLNTAAKILKDEMSEIDVRKAEALAERMAPKFPVKKTYT